MQINGAVRIGAMAAVITLAGCSGGGTDATSASVDVAAGFAEATDSGLAPDFSLKTTEGEVVRLADSAGQVRLVDFWATWCAPCREEIPMLNELEEIYGSRGFKVLAIGDENESTESIRQFLVKHDVRYTNVLGSADVAKEYNVLSLPSAFLLDRNGAIVDSFQGPKPRKMLEEKIEALLDGTAG